MRLLGVCLALTFVQVSLALYTVLSKAALSTGMDAGVFTIVRDSICASVLTLNARKTMGRFTLPSSYKDHFLFIVLGLFGLYFGQYYATLGVKFGSPLLSATWSNSIPLATYALGLLLGVEELDRSLPNTMKLVGLILAVGGAIGTTIATAAANSNDQNRTKSDLVLASVFFALQVLFGGAGFWHLQKRLLSRYSAAQVAAYYYVYGIVILALAILPHSTTAAQWTFKGPDRVALVYAVFLWPSAAFLLTYANAQATPVLVMAFAPLQIVATTLLNYMLKHVEPTLAEVGASSVVVAGLACFLTGTFLREEAKEGNDCLLEEDHSLHSLLDEDQDQDAGDEHRGTEAFKT